MTLLETIRFAEDIARKQPAVNMIVENDVFRLSALPDVKYGVFAFTQGRHEVSVGGDIDTFVFTFFYVDRLLADGSNQIEIQSTGVQVLRNILRTMSEAGLVVSDLSVQPFNQRFADECSGCYCEARIGVPSNGICAEFGWEEEQ